MTKREIPSKLEDKHFMAGTDGKESGDNSNRIVDGDNAPEILISIKNVDIAYALRLTGKRF